MFFGVQAGLVTLQSSHVFDGTEDETSAAIAKTLLLTNL